MATAKLLQTNSLRRHGLSLLLPLPVSPSFSSVSSFSHLSSFSHSHCHSDSFVGCIPHSPPSFRSFHSVLYCHLPFLRSFSTLPDPLLSNSESGVHVEVGDDSILPVRAVISLLDSYHDLTGFPWWFVIASSTLAIRLALFPVLVLQLHKLKRISELFPRLPPPLPPPLSGRSFKDQISLFWREKKGLGCPSYLWFLSYFSIQFPCFLLWMTSIRRMSLDHHSGFDCGGILWFQNLTECPNGVLGALFPLSIAALYFTNIQISFRKSVLHKTPGFFGLLAKYYKRYLDILTLPTFFITFFIPQGSLVYWATNGLLTLTQQLLLNHPDFREMLGLPDKRVVRTETDPGKVGTSLIAERDSSTKQRNISVENLSPQELVALSVKLLAAGGKERAVPLLRLALNKDPGHVRAMIVMGQTLLQEGLLVEAIEYLERAISKLFLMGHPSVVEEVDLLIIASQWVGSAYIRQGKKTEGVVHLERIACLKEPEDIKSKVHYFDGLVMLASALFNEGRKDEAAKYLRMAVAYNPDFNVYLEQCQNDDNFVGDLVSSRRADY